jgi:hypothetical protein
MHGTFTNTYKSVAGKPIRDSLLGRQGNRLEYNTTIGLGVGDWIDRFQIVICRDLVNSVMIIQIQLKYVTFK